MALRATATSCPRTISLALAAAAPRLQAGSVCSCVLKAGCGFVVLDSAMVWNVPARPDGPDTIDAFGEDSSSTLAVPAGGL